MAPGIVVSWYNDKNIQEFPAGIFGLDFFWYNASTLGEDGEVKFFWAHKLCLDFKSAVFADTAAAGVPLVPFVRGGPQVQIPVRK